MELITVGIPIYNIEQVVGKCIESIINQTYDNLEIILVDDGSTDSSGEICDRYSERDRRIKVIHQKNSGLSDARNAAINAANGRYITFVDGDDYADEDYVEYLYKLLTDNNADMSSCRMKYVDKHGKVTKDFSNKKVLVMSQKQALYEILNHRRVDNSSCGKLYKTEHFEKARFPSGKTFEDVATTYRLVFQCEKIVCGEKAKYNYFQRSGSISHKEFVPSRMDAIEFGEKMTSDIALKYPELFKMAECRRFDSYIAVLRLTKNTSHKDVYDKTMQMLKKVRKTVLLYPAGGFDRKALALASLFGIIL